MSTFRRTIGGLNNQHVFFGVDYIVYVEGGSNSFTKDEVYNDRYNNDTEDIHFWRKIFTLTQPNIKYKFKSVGSKTTLIDISNDLKNGSLNRIYLAMDSEFDEVLNKRLNHPNIFYTHGYSYENDIWSDEVIISILTDITATEIDVNFIKNGYSKFIKDIKLAVIADGYYFSKGSSFFPRKKGHLFCIECTVDNFPDVKKDIIDSLIQQKNGNISTIRGFGYRKKIQIKKLCFGHLLADYCCQIIIHYLKKNHQIQGMKKDILYRMAISKFFDKIYHNSEVKIYYNQQLSI